MTMLMNRLQIKTYVTVIHCHYFYCIRYLQVMYYICYSFINFKKKFFWVESKGMKIQHVRDLCSEVQIEIVKITFLI